MPVVVPSSGEGYIQGALFRIGATRFRGPDDAPGVLLCCVHRADDTKDPLR